jgi:hypothetical protein
MSDVCFIIAVVVLGIVLYCLSWGAESRDTETIRFHPKLNLALTGGGAGISLVS